MKKKKILGMPIALFAIALVVVGGASAALLVNVGVINFNAEVSQSVLLDGEDYTQVNEETVEIVAGEYVCRDHNLESKIDTPISLSLESTENVGINYEYYEVDNERILSESDFTDSSFEFDVSVEMEEDGLRIFVEDGNPGDIYYPYASAIILDSEKNFKFNAGYNSEAKLNGWNGIYKLYSSGWGTAQDSDSTDIEVDYVAKESVEIFIPNSMLDNSDLVGLNVEGIGSGSAKQSKYPSAWGWSSGDGVSLTKKNTLSSPFTLLGLDYMDFEICYDFDNALAPGDYELDTNIVFN